MPISRRDFLKGMGVTVGGLGLATAGFTRLIPYVDQPEDIVPGVSTWYATSCRECPAGCSMIVRNRESHAVKCEGNPHSPINGGTLCSRGQAALQGLYDPDRIKNPLRGSEDGVFTDVSWDNALKSIGETLSHQPRIAFVSDLESGALDALITTWLSAFKSARHITYEPINYESIKAVSGGIIPTFDIDKSDYLISFGADFLETWISPVEYARKFAEMRTLKDGKRPKFVYIGPRVSMTAVNADHRLIVPPGASREIANALTMYSDLPTRNVARKYGLDFDEMWKIAGDLVDAKSPLALPGIDPDSASAAMHINSMRPNNLVNITRPHALSRTANEADMKAFISDMNKGRFDLVVVYRANPVYAMPESSGFTQALDRVPTVVSLSSFMDETTAKADWVLPSNTPLESWGDYTPYPNASNLMQPTMGTLFNTRHTGDILLDLAKAAGLVKATSDQSDPSNPSDLPLPAAEDFYAYLRRHWSFPLAPGETAENVSPKWESLMQKGGRWGSVSASQSSPQSQTMPGLQPSGVPEEGKIALWAYPSLYLFDGRGANKRWLQEMPEPVTHGVWGTWAEIHPSTAKRLGLSSDDMVEISQNGVKIRVPAIITEGVALETVAVPIGEGHHKYGQFAADIGANVLSLLSTASPYVEIRRTGETKWAARIKGSDDQSGRDIVQTAGLSEPFRRKEEVILPLPAGYKKNDFYPGHKYDKHRWAMTIDLDRCIGCHACVTACYAENNIPVVGADGVWRRREMQWIRIDRYTDWKDPSAPVLFQPMLCQQCDAAPCEPVCPVYASSHDTEGLNMQIYNRCVGTRYCSHNCPYKVRRFNWFDYKFPTPLNYQLNPDVTVRCRGVMEKCTFCIQRIREAEMTALRENRDVKDGEITPACVQTCPTGVFTFGDLMDPNSRVSKIIQEDPRAYQVLRELNTKPAVIYLKKIVDRK